MQELEKILEEIDAIKVGFDTECASECDFFDWSCGACVGECDEYIKEKVKEIIRKHMNDGWIPCEERLPGTQKVLITDGEIVMRGYRRPDGTWKYGVDENELFSKLSSIDVIAWQPLPEPYRPERSEG